MPDLTQSPQLSPDRVRGYLDRVGVTEPPVVSAGWLDRLHAAHLQAVPFENLDIHAGRRIRLDLDGLYAKIVDGGRGGFCYELNGLFAALLHSVGFPTTLVSSRVWLPGGTLSPPHDHATLLVDIDGPWLVDVGYGDAFVHPHRLGEEWTEPGRRLRTVAVEGGWRLETDRGDGWSPMYDLDPTPRRSAEFGARCRWHETDPASFFRREPLASRAVPAGRVSVLGGRLVRTEHGRRAEQQLDDPATFRAAVERHFDPPVTALLLDLHTRQRATMP